MQNEKVIQFLWQHQLLDITNLKTVHDDPIRVIKPGIINFTDGPDFSDAQLSIGNLEWFGSIEIHIVDADWQKHGHESDKKYENVILHVVWELKDSEAIPKEIPCLVLKPYVSNDILNKYQKLMESKEKLPCSSQFNKVSSLTKIHTLETMAFQRIQRKADILYDQLISSEIDWRQIYFQLFAQALGKKFNKIPMLHLSNILNINQLLKHSDQELTLEAMLFGVAGLLDESAEGIHAERLKREFDFVKNKFNLDQLTREHWSFSKTRGSSRPHLSMAILLGLIKQFQNASNHFEIVNGLKNLDLTTYWQLHYDFEKKSGRKNSISEELIDHLNINVTAPYLKLLSIYYSDESFTFQAQTILEDIKKEQNSITEELGELGFSITNAFESQGAIELKNEFCNAKRCIECSIGKSLVVKE